MNAQARRLLAGGLAAAVATITTGCAAVGAVASAAEPTPDPSPTPDLIWSDEFEGNAGDRPDPWIWSAQTGGGGWGNAELQTYTSESVRLDGKGHLAITARLDDPATGGPTSGRITTQGKGSFRYGRLEARIQLPEGQGLLPAFWLLGDDLDEVGWPAAGEIDVVETPNTTSTSAHHVHMPAADSDGRAAVNSTVAHDLPLADDFHVYTLDKSPGLLRIQIDGRTVLTVSKDELPKGATWVFEQDFHVLFSLAIGGNWPGNPDATTPAVSTMLIDWIRLWPSESSPQAPTQPSPTPSPSPTATVPASTPPPTRIRPPWGPWWWGWSSE
ncbi:glycoside hydrolase family 16 protein [Homoserinibacter sp. GY 40078]|uniref:glycoside hydrolase family 16 protein n=1 Tax=Homoserinibacter sp. GY 40078 TaxID=2603275 RepID=UPI0011CBB35D|nr:glycoside hydrolase family 16 protein [Homoserinibacter sp. GY 40078]TXK17096.1 glycoside hydrolase family 16 protein [Homoserinibacter sp. GY 40078]